MTTEAASDTTRTVRGIRWALLIGLATMPMSFLTNAILGRISPAALGTYGATQLFVATFQVFLIFGGNAVFQRIVPRLAPPRRLSFLVSYGGLVLLVAGAAFLAALLAFPDRTRQALDRLQAPPLALLAMIGASVVVWAFTSHFLFAVQRAAFASAALKSVVVGYLLASSLWWAAGGPATAEETGRYLWVATAVIHGAAAAIGIAAVIGTPECRLGLPGLSWYLPPGFWVLVLITHVGTLVDFVYGSFAPAFVLAWLDVESLGRLHAALRFPALLSVVPATLTAVLAPGLASLDAQGRAPEAVRLASSAIRACLVFLAPGSILLCAFAPDAMRLFGPDFTANADLLRLSIGSVLAVPLLLLGSGLAIALGRLRAYLVAGVAFVLLSAGATSVLVPTCGLAGAAAAQSVAALLFQGVVGLTLFGRLGLRADRRVGAAWGCVLGFAAISWLWDPGRLAAALGAAGAISGFGWLGGVTLDEVKGLLRRLGRRG